MSHPAISNLIVKSYEPTAHSCLRCLSAYATHETETFAKHGCHFFDLSEADEVTAELYDNCKVMVKVDGKEDKEDKEAPFMTCHRCFLLRQPCIAVPKEYVEKMEPINKHLRRVRAYHENTGIFRIAEGEEGYVEPRPAADGQPAVRHALRAPTKDEGRDAAYHLALLSKSLVEKVGKTHHPQNTHCFLHSGAFDVKDDAESQLHPVIQSRSKSTVVAKSNANTQHVQNLTDAHAKGLETPSKKRKAGVFANDKAVTSEVAILEVQIEDCKRKISADESAKAAASAHAKRALTVSIKGHHKEIQRLRGLIDDLLK